MKLAFYCGVVRVAYFTAVFVLFVTQFETFGTYPYVVGFAATVWGLAIYDGWDDRRRRDV
jgi:hypothetical protein